MCGTWGRPGPLQIRHPPPLGAQPDDDDEPLDEALAKAETWRSTRELRQRGQVTPSLPADIDWSF